MYKLIALDMDGTLLKNDKTISDKTLKAIISAKKKGVKIVLATGRPADGIKRYLKELNLISESDYAITFNGSLVENVSTHEVLYRSTLSAKDLKYLHNISKELKVNMHAFTSEGCMTPKMSKYTELEANINKLDVKIIDFETVPDDTEVIKFMMVDEARILDEITKILPKELYSKYTIVRSAFCFLEFLNKEANKGEAVKTLANHLNINIEDVICIGDAGNDFHMIKYAGLGVAMGNAYEEIKNIADYITHSNEEDGIAHVIDKFILAG